MTISFSRDAQERRGFLFELYHENSKLNGRSTSSPVDETSVSFSARSFRGCAGGKEVDLPELQANEFDKVIAERRSRRDLCVPLTLVQIGAMLNAGAGVTGLMQEGDGPTFVLRAAPSGGALYPVELFVAVRDVIDLPPVVYYFHPLRNSLVTISGADRAKIAGHGFFLQDWVAEASAIILLVAHFARNTWKYGERGYRLALLDAGHLAQNILLKAEDLGCPACAVGGFNDQLIAQELLMDGVNESVLHAIAVGGGGDDLRQSR